MPESDEKPFLSLIVPAYNEALRLPLTLMKAAAYLDRKEFISEVLVVDDGSTDATSSIVATLARTWPCLRLLRTPHRGKGHAVRAGVLASRGQFVFLCDADLSMPISELDRFVCGHPDDTVVAIASREGPGAQRFNEPVDRHIMGRVFNAFVRWMVLPRIQDSQCGFKFLPGDLARAMATAQTLDGWGFDVELLAIARHWGYRIVEIPIAWYHVRSSRIRPVRDTWHMVGEVLTVRRNLRLGLYTLPDASAFVAPRPSDDHSVV